MLTPYPDLDAALATFVGEVRGILGETFVGAYLQGSFALGAGDETSDCDFIVATTEAPRGSREDALRRLHDGIPLRDGFWNGHLEGSYAPVASLRVPNDDEWLYCDHGHRELIWSTHCNSLHTRWILRNHGITIVGPPIASLVDPVPTEEMRRTARDAIPGSVQGIFEWASPDWAWTQRYIVQTYCRMFYTAETGGVASKPAALDWALTRFDPRWRPLLEQVRDDRPRGADELDPPRPGTLDRSIAFASYVEGLL